MTYGSWSHHRWQMVAWLIVERRIHDYRWSRGHLQDVGSLADKHSLGNHRSADYDQADNQMTAQISTGLGSVGGRAQSGAVACNQWPVTVTQVILQIAAVGRSVAGAACGGELSTVQPGSQVMGSGGLLAAVSRVQSLTQGSDWLLVQPATGLQLHNRRDGGHQWGIVVWPRQLFLNQQEGWFGSCIYRHSHSRM